MFNNSPTNTAETNSLLGTTTESPKKRNGWISNIQPLFLVSFTALMVTIMVCSVWHGARIAANKLEIPLLSSVESTLAAKADRVKTIPLYGKPPSPQWSGFLDASESSPGTYLHYWFIHKQTTNIDYLELSDDDSIPVVIWLNGGPGSSSILGLLTELGPLILKDDGSGFVENPFSWSTAAHLLVLESPAGVGFSVCQNWTIPGGVCANSDDRTSQDATAAIIDFYETKFPSLKSNPLYITGESYAGVYVPTFAKEIIKYNEEIRNIGGKMNPGQTFEIPLVGLAIGDPCVDNDSQNEIMDMIYYSQKQGFITDELYDQLHNTCDLVKSFGELFHGSEFREGPAETEEHITNNDNDLNLVEERGVMMTRECQLAFRKFLIKTSMGISQGFENFYINPYALLEPPNPAYDEALLAYMNRDDVKLALNIVKKNKNKLVPVIAGINTKWSEYGGDEGRVWTYHKQYDACNPRVSVHVPKSKRPPSMIDILRDIVPKLDIAIVYNGDSDPCVSFEGTRTAVERIGFNILPGGEYRPWFYNATSIPSELIETKPFDFGSSLSVWDEGLQFGGHIVSYENKLSFVTIHGSGHMVPQTRPRAALRLLRHLVNGERGKDGKSSELLSPTIASDDKISQMTEDEFEVYVSKWTKIAKQTGA